MNTHTSHSFVPACVLGLLAGWSSVRADDQGAGLIKRGEYLVNNVGMCGDCHTPRGERGALVMEKHLQGAPLGFAPSVPMPVWADYALPIAGLPGGWGEADMVKYLTEGVRPGGLPPTRPPMPEFRLNEADAKAVAAYIRSLKPAGS